MTDARRLSQAIAEGDGISVLVTVADAASAIAAQEQGADGLAVESGDGLRDSTHLPLLAFVLPDMSGDVDALVIDAGVDGDALAGLVEEVHARGLECVLRVRDEEELVGALEAVDPEILLLSVASSHDADAADQLAQILELLPDIPAGKLAIADLPGASREDVLELERAGVDAVIVSSSDVGSLVGDTLPDV